MADCHKCCFWPCDRTNRACADGVYFVKSRHGTIIKMVELPEPTKTIVSKAVEKALGI